MKIYRCIFHKSCSNYGESLFVWKSTIPIYLVIVCVSLCYHHFASITSHSTSKNLSLRGEDVRAVGGFGNSNLVWNGLETMSTSVFGNLCFGGWNSNLTTGLGKVTVRWNHLTTKTVLRWRFRFDFCSIAALHYWLMVEPPIWKILVNWKSSPIFGVNIKNIWNHHLDWFVQQHWMAISGEFKLINKMDRWKIEWICQEASSVLQGFYTFQGTPIVCPKWNVTSLQFIHIVLHIYRCIYIVLYTHAIFMSLNCCSLNSLPRWLSL